MKSILIVTEQFAMGGLETHIRGEIARLVKLGVDVHLAVGQVFDNALLPDDCSFVTHGLPLGTGSTPDDLLYSVNELREIIHEYSIEGVHCHPFTSIVPAAIAAELEEVPFAVTLHGPASLASYYGPTYELLVKNYVLSAASLIVAVSPETERMVLDHASSESVALIPNSVSFNSIRPGFPLSAEEDSHWVVVSRLDQFKIPGILDFCKKAHHAGIPAVRIAGDGPAQDELTQLLNENCLLGYAKLLGASAQVTSLMRKASGVAGMGRVVLEGIAANRPVVLVGYDGVKGIVDTELLIKAADVNFSGRGLPTVSADELVDQICLKATELNSASVYEVAKRKFDDLANWAVFLQRLRDAPVSKPASLSGLYRSLLASPIKGEAPYLYSAEFLDRLNSIICSKRYYEPRLAHALKLCAQRVQHNGFNQLIAERDARIIDLTQAISDRDHELAKLVQKNAEHDKEIASLKQALFDRDSSVGRLNQEVAECNMQISCHNQVILERDCIIAELNQTVTESGRQIASLSQVIADRDDEISRLGQLAAERNTLLHEADLYKEDKEIYIAMLRNELNSINSRIDQKILKSFSRLKRVPYYARRSASILRSRGIGGLLNAVSFKLRYQSTGNSNNYIQPPVSDALVATEKTVGDIVRLSDQPLLRDSLVIITGVPFDDVGGGQRAAQIARCALKTGRRVVYLYIYKRYDFELNKYVESEINVYGLIHKHIEVTSPNEVLRLVSPDSTLLVELPHKAALPYVQVFNSRGIRTVFELIDDWESSLGGDWFDANIYRRFVNEANVVVGTAKVLVQKLIDLGRSDALYLPNAANEYIFDKYKSYSRPVDLPGNFKRIGLYFGSLYGEWFAWEYLQEAADKNADMAFVLIGDKPSPDRLPMLPSNIIFLGAKQIQELPAYLAYSDISLLPFLPGKISDAVSPIKVFEYLFSGSPVIATRLPEIVGYPGVLVANSPQEFAHLCGEAFISEEAVLENDKFIFNNSWFSRLENLVSLGKGSQFRDSVSVIILIHNNKNIIGRCLESILLHCSSYLKEIIVVDNSSDDGGAEFIESNFSSVCVVRNVKNGCSSGRNLGAKVATGKFLAFFDSDQWVTSSSGFEEALAILSRDAIVGAVGWAGGWFEDGREDLGGMIADYCPNRAMHDLAIRIGYRSDIGYLGTGGFFVPRAVFDATDGFDVAYDPTCFEDTDMSFQIKKLGLDVCYRDLTGIRHQPHQTTKASSGSDAYTKLFKRNADYFKKKWVDYPQFYVDYLN